MGKNNKKKKKGKNEFLDMSYRKKIDIDLNQKYNDEELYVLIEELNEQIKQLNDLHKKYYSSNAYIERICKRTFFDILQEKIESILANLTFKSYYESKKKS